MRALAFLLVGALLVAYVLWVNDARMAAVAGPNATAESARYHFEGLSLRRTDARGQPTLLLEIARADYFDSRRAMFSGVSARAANGDVAPWKLSAPSADLPAGERRLRLNPPVSGSGAFPDGEPLTLAAGAVWLDEASRTMRSDAPIRLTSASRDVRAKGFTAALNGSALQLRSVEMRYALP
jgi:LPS export ABC transporter protein LptC